MYTTYLHNSLQKDFPFHIIRGSQMCKYFSNFTSNQSSIFLSTSILNIVNDIQNNLLSTVSNHTSTCSYQNMYFFFSNIT